MKMNHKRKTLVIALALGLGLTMGSVQAKDLKLGVDANAVSLDIQMQLSGNMLQLSKLAYDELVRFDQKLEIQPRLATKWEYLNDTTLRVKLRENVKFHSGNPFTADDVVWTFNRLKKSEDFKGIFVSILEAKKVDDYTVDFITDGPYPLLLTNLTYVFPMDSKFFTGKDDKGQDKDLIAKTGYSFANEHESGTGPFIVKKVEQGVKTEFTRNPDYWDKESKGNIDNLTMVAIKESSTRSAALLSGDLDVIMPVAPTEFKLIEKKDDLKLLTLSGTRLITVQMNENTAEPLKNLKVRQAIVHAINNKGIVEKIMRGFATATAQQSPEGYQGYNSNLKPRFDLAKAKELMKEAGYEKGFTLTMISPNNRYLNDEKIAQAIAAMLAKINIKVELKTFPISQYWTEFDKCAADLQLIGWQSDTQDSANLTEYLTMTRNDKTGKGQYNCNGYSNPKVDDLIKQANSELDVPKRKQMLQEVEQILYDDAAFIPLHFQNISAASKKNIEMEKIVNVVEYLSFGDLTIK